MQDEYGRPLSDDGQWVWDGSAWRPTGAAPAAGPGQAGYDPAAYDPTRALPPESARASSRLMVPAAPLALQGPQGLHRLRLLPGTRSPR